MVKLKKKVQSLLLLNAYFQLTVFMAYLKAITPFYPSTLETMYSNFSGLLTLIETDYKNCGI